MTFPTTLVVGRCVIPGRLYPRFGQDAALAWSDASGSSNGDTNLVRRAPLRAMSRLWTPSCSWGTPSLRWMNRSSLSQSYSPHSADASSMLLGHSPRFYTRREAHSGAGPPTRARYFCCEWQSSVSDLRRSYKCNHPPFQRLRKLHMWGARRCTVIDPVR